MGAYEDGVAAGGSGGSSASDWQLATKTVTFTGAAGAGAVGTVALFTVSGLVQVRDFFVHCTTNLVDAGGGSPATLDFGVVGNAGALTNGTPFNPADGIDSGDVLNVYQGDDTVGGSTVATGGAAGIATVANVIGTVANEAIDSGVIVCYLWWRPLASGATLVAA